MFNVKNKINIVATILVRNEEDIIQKNIEHHINQGVTQFIITDNGSTDKTKEIIEKFPEVKEIIDEPEHTHNQSKWVTKMAQIACKLNPDWIIHLDADEFWCGFGNLRTIEASHASSPRMYLHPPRNCEFDLENMKFYLDFDHFYDLKGECKVFHRPDPDVIIEHGNHGFTNKKDILYTHQIWRHHYPVRSYEQFVKKTIEGHEALERRGSVCERWKKWYDLYNFGQLKSLYLKICQSWENMIKNPNKDYLMGLLEFWSPPEVISYMQSKNLLPNIGEWPKTKQWRLNDQD
jgi:glycosyltransferase involved in cell wall biosynthesis